MTAKGFTTPERVQDYLAASFTIDQLRQVVSLIEPAEQRIERECGRTWLATAITGERHDLTYSSQVTLYHAPIASVQAVNGYLSLAGSPTVLVEDIGWEVIDAGLGQIELLQLDLDHILVNYTPVSVTVPAQVELATRMLVAHWFQDTLHPETAYMESMTDADGLALRYRGRGSINTSRPLPPVIRDLLPRALVLA